MAIKGDRIAAVGDVAYAKGPETRVIDARGRFVTPGLVEGHLHQYHSYLGVTEYVQALLSHGVTATADGFYGPGIVAGVPAIRFFKEAFERMPIRLIFLVPTLAWLQNRELGLTPTPGIERRQTARDPRVGRLLRARGAAVPAGRRALPGVPRPVRRDAAPAEGDHRPRCGDQLSASSRRTRRSA